MYSSLLLLRVLILLLLVGCSARVNAEMAPIDLKKTYFEYVPVQGQISLESQFVVIRLKKNTYVVVEELEFFNTGATASQWVGIPKVGSGVLPWWRPRPDFCDYDFISITAFVNSRKVEFQDNCLLIDCSGYSRSSCPHGSNKSRVLAKRMTFPGHSRLKFRLIYEVGYMRPNPNTKKLSFCLGFGSRWSGKMGKCVIRIDVSAIRGIAEVIPQFSWFPEAPKPKRISENVLEYSMINFEPHDSACLNLHFTDSK